MSPSEPLDGQDALLPVPAPWRPRHGTDSPRWSRRQRDAQRVTCDDCVLARAEGSVAFEQRPALWRVQYPDGVVRLLCTIHARRRGNRR